MLPHYTHKESMSEMNDFFELTSRLLEPDNRELELKMLRHLFFRGLAGPHGVKNLQELPIYGDTWAAIVNAFRFYEQHPDLLPPNHELWFKDEIEDLNALTSGPL